MKYQSEICMLLKISETIKIEISYIKMNGLLPSKIGIFFIIYWLLREIPLFILGSRKLINNFVNKKDGREITAKFKILFLTLGFFIKFRYSSIIQCFMIG